MEEIPSSNDSDGDPDSDDISKEREEELYAVLHYNDFSQGVPPELLEKYCISTDENNEFVISFKNSAEQAKHVSDRDDGSKPTYERREELTPLKSAVTAKSPQDSSCDDDVVVVELELANSVNKGCAGVESKLTQNRKRDRVDVSVESTHTLNPKRNVDVQLKLPPSRLKGSEDTVLQPDSNPKKRHLHGAAVEEKLSPNTKKRNSEHAGESGMAAVPKKRKSVGESTLTPFSKERDSVVESRMAPNPKKRKSTDDGGPKPDRISEHRNHEAARESKMALNPKSRASGASSETNCISPLKEAVEVVVEENSESDDSSCVVIENPEINRKISISSSESVVALLSSEDEVSGFSLNTTEDIPYDSDGNVSDVIEKSQFEWEAVASPSTWTHEMRKYYNGSCERLRYFDHKKIRQQIKTGSRRDWMISPRDLFPNNRPQQRCLICRQTGHLARNCPKKNPTCHMCGSQGHSNMDCPNSICLQCGKKNRQFTSVCRSCTHTLNRECFSCKQAGHESKACPEKWREFHSTTEGPLKKEKKHHAGSRAAQCCNCGKANHTFEECNQQYMSSFAKSLPAYDWLFGRGSSNEDWRAAFSGFSPRNRNSFEPPFKRRREHHDRDSFSDGLPRWRPSPKAKNKKKKKRKKHNPVHNTF